MNELPKDPFMLLSTINMKLRDGDYDSLESLCDDLEIESEELKETLGNAGFEYIPEINQFR